MGSHSVTCHPAAVTFPPLPRPNLVIDLGARRNARLSWAGWWLYHKIVRPPKQSHISEITRYMLSRRHRQLNTLNTLCWTFLNPIVRRAAVGSLQCRCLVRGRRPTSWCVLLVHLDRHTLTTARNELVTVLEITWQVGNAEHLLTHNNSHAVITDLFHQIAIVTN